MAGWKDKFDEARMVPAKDDVADFFNANLDAAREALEGTSAFAGGRPRPALRAVINLPAVRAVRFLAPEDAARGQGIYENRYTYAARVGRALPEGSVREEIDQALAGLDASGKLTTENGHYATMELNGTGVRYYGDVCLVPKDDAVTEETLVLERNSYEVRVPPAARDAGTTQDKLAAWVGTWGADAIFMAARKVVSNHPKGTRRMTTGTVSDGLVADEEYLEVVLPRDVEERGDAPKDERLRPSELSELRVTAEDAAHEALIGDQARVGMAPTGAQALWRYRRRVAAMLARRRGLPFRVVTTTGRAQ